MDTPQTPPSPQQNQTPQPPGTAPTEPQPVAYDSQGRPLYHHPPVAPAPQQQAPQTMVTSRPDSYEGHNFDPRLRTQHANEPGLTHATREYEPKVAQISDELRQKHEKSVQQYPFLNLSEGEFVMMQISRHPIGLFIPAGVTVFLLLILSIVSLALPSIYPDTPTAGPTILPVELLIGGVTLLMLLVAAVGGISIWVYLRNQFYLTNESIIQEIQHSLFSRHEQTVSLGSVEDASYKKQGILQHIFNYGTMRLSTEGEETTYRFAFVEHPKEQIATVNNAVEAFKNGRPVGLDHLDT